MHPKWVHPHVLRFYQAGSLQKWVCILVASAVDNSIYAFQLVAVLQKMTQLGKTKRKEKTRLYKLVFWHQQKEAQAQLWLSRVVIVGLLQQQGSVIQTASHSIAADVKQARLCMKQQQQLEQTGLRNIALFKPQHSNAQQCTAMVLHVYWLFKQVRKV